MDDIYSLSSLRLHQSFSVKECTYLSGDRGIIYSPLGAETLLCDPCVIHFLTELELKPGNAVKNFFETHPVHAREIIAKLRIMNIFQVEE